MLATFLVPLPILALIFAGFVRRRDGREEVLPGCAQTRLEAGDAIAIRTPTGGRFGRP